MDVPVILNDDDLTSALRQIDALWNAAPGTKRGDRLDILIAVTSDYEDARYAIPKIAPSRF